MAPEAPSPGPQCAPLLNKLSPPKSREKTACCLSFQMRNNSQAKLLSRLRLLAETHPTYSRAQSAYKEHTALSRLFFYVSIFPFLSSPCSPSVNITREQALENRTELLELQMAQNVLCEWVG